MGRKRFTKADPTANAAIGNVSRTAPQRENRMPSPTASAHTLLTIISRFPAVFDGVVDTRTCAAAAKALQLAGGDPRAVTEHHIRQAQGS